MSSNNILHAKYLANFFLISSHSMTIYVITAVYTYTRCCHVVAILQLSLDGYNCPRYASEVIDTDSIVIQLNSVIFFVLYLSLNSNYSWKSKIFFFFFFNFPLRSIFYLGYLRSFSCLLFNFILILFFILRGS